MTFLNSISVTSYELYFALFLAATLTYITRSFGYVLLSQAKALHPRLEAALVAVPAAVLTTLVAPHALTNGYAEAIAMLFAGILCIKIPAILTIFLSIVILTLLR